MIVVDASVLANALADMNAGGAKARDVLRDASQGSIPDLADVETMSVLRKRWQRGDLKVERFRAAMIDLAALPLARYPSSPLMQRAFELRDNLTPYDACYVALAEELACPLYTADRRLAHAPGRKCEIRIVA